MGSFGGHALPGSFFMVFALWWTVQLFRRIYQSARRGGQPFRAAITFRCDFLCGRFKDWEWEGFFKIFFTLVGFIGEVVTATHDGVFLHIGNGQHATMFFFFGLSGLVDVMVHQRVPLPRGIEYIAGLFAVVVETVLFMFHLHERSSLDVVIHTLLIYVLYATIAVILLEMRYRNSVMIVWTRIYLFFLQGTWFWQVAFILYNPNPRAVKWDGEDHEQIMVATMMFAWHMAAILVVMLSIGLVVQLVMRCCDDDDGTAYEIVDLRILTGNGSVKAGNGNGIADYHDDFSDSDNNSGCRKPIKFIP